jgi:hypothetical protein
MPTKRKNPRLNLLLCSVGDKNNNLLCSVNLAGLHKGFRAGLGRGGFLQLCSGKGLNKVLHASLGRSAALSAYEVPEFGVVVQDF